MERASYFNNNELAKKKKMSFECDYLTKAK